MTWNIHFNVDIDLFAGVASAWQETCGQFYDLKSSGRFLPGFECAEAQDLRSEMDVDQQSADVQVNRSTNALMHLNIWTSN